MAKAVRIRIRSGNEEHTSLDSLKRNFSIEDIEPLLIDGRLERWLRQKGEETIADEIHSILNIVQDKKDNYQFKILSIFFPGITSDLIELAKCWLNSSGYKKNGEYLFSYLAHHGNSQAAIYLFKHDILPPDITLLDLLSPEQGEKDSTGDIQYILGICYFEGKGVDKDIEKGNDLITKAYDKKQDDAMAFVKERRYEKAQENSITLDIQNESTMELAKSYCHTFGRWTQNDYLRTKTQVSNDYIKLLAEFLYDCSVLLNKNILSEKAISETLGKYEKYKGYFDTILFLEALAIYKSQGPSRKYLNTLSKIKDSYPPANFLLESNEEKSNRGYKLTAFFDFENKPIKECIIYTIHHFYDYN